MRLFLLRYGWIKLYYELSWIFQEHSSSVKSAYALAPCHQKISRSDADYRILRWSHNGHNGISTHQCLNCLLNRLFRHRSKETSKLRVTGLCVGNSPVTGEFPTGKPVTRKMFPFHDVIMISAYIFTCLLWANCKYLCHFNANDYRKFFFRTILYLNG